MSTIIGKTPQLLSERNRDILRKRKQGVTLQEIADEYGLTRERVRQITENLEPGVKQRVKDQRSERNAELRYFCPRCGDRVEYGGRIPGTICIKCTNEQPPYWTEERIINAMIEFRRLIGRFPSASDWNPALARMTSNDHVLRTHRYYAHNWPSTTTVITRFDGWSIAVDAAEREYARRGSQDTADDLEAA